MLYEGDNPFAEYVKVSDIVWEKYRVANNRHTNTEKLVSYHTAECAEQVEKAADLTMLAVYHVKEVLHER